ncbi:MAG: hypothetical protein ACI4PW_06150 [Alphaproteobacteria bacterium]|jgi:anti-sigma regulatory factor (Ser/Thr protein kinase)
MKKVDNKKKCSLPGLFYAAGIKEGEALAKAVAEAADAMMPGLERQRISCRLAVHEAVLNALKHGGGEAFVALVPEKEGVCVQIRQNGDVVFPPPSRAFGGTALIRRCSRKQDVSEDKKILSLWFY